MNSSKPKLVVVVGDWFLDENWLVSRRHASTSSHTGHFHYLSNHPSTSDRMINLCGAGAVLEVLVRFFLQKYIALDELPFRFIGYGAWNPLDDTNLKCTLCSKRGGEREDFQAKIHSAFTPYSINGLKAIPKRSTDGWMVCPYDSQCCDYIDKETQDELMMLENLTSKPCSTNRIYRIYEGYGKGDPELLYRFDWQTPLMADRLNRPMGEELGRIGMADGDKAKAIIIEDHGKGVVCEDTITQLVETFYRKDYTNIYVRTKRHNPPWLKTLQSSVHKKIRLQVIDNEQAIRRKGSRRFRYGNNLGRAALELLGELTGDDSGVGSVGGQPKSRDDSLAPAQRVAAFFDQNSAFSKDGDMCFDLGSVGSKQLINVGRTTVFFTALIAQDLDSAEKSNQFGEQCKQALRCGFEWSKAATQQWAKEKPQFYGYYDEALKSLSTDGDAVPCREQSYKEAWTQWQTSSNDLGIVSKRKVETIELWRGIGSIPEYVCVGGSKRDSINDLVRSLADYLRDPTPKHPFNSMLIAGPGWGKSFLAKKLAGHFNLEYREFSVAQMASAQDLVDCFDSICSMQGLTDKRLLIFLDEVNSEIEGNTAMHLLLSPIWDGTFVRAGKSYKISPAVWIFASTETLDATMSLTNKGTDFVSRLNGPVVELDAADVTLADENRVQEIKKHLPDVGRHFSVSVDRPNRWRDLQDLELPSFLEELKRYYFAELKDLKRQRALNPLFNYLEDSNFWIIGSDFRKLIAASLMTEQVYLGVTLLIDRWGFVSKVQREVLKLFHDLIPINGIRSLEFFVSRFQHIDRGIVRCSSVPSLADAKELGRHVVLPQEWVDGAPRDTDDQLVVIESKPLEEDEEGRLSRPDTPSDDHELAHGLHRVTV